MKEKFEPNDKNEVFRLFADFLYYASFYANPHCKLELLYAIPSFEIDSRVLQSVLETFLMIQYKWVACFYNWNHYINI